jgi:transposase-like protein
MLVVSQFKIRLSQTDPLLHSPPFQENYQLDKPTFILYIDLVTITNEIQMNKKTTKNQPKLYTLLDLTKRFPDEKSCREELAKIRWNGKPVCLKCGSMRKIYQINDGKLLKCADCRKQFTVRVGTIFEDSALPLQKWFFAIYIFMAHKKGISSIQLGKDIGVSQQTAWFMLHRIRYAIRTRSLDKPLNGIVEVDETAIGGRTYGQGSGYSQPNKTSVFGMKQRNGIVRAQTVKRVNGETLKPIIRKDVSPDAVIMSDEFGAYYGLDKEFADHQIVIHSKKEYVRGNAHTNGIESFWALLKRGITGIYHHVSREHLDKYIDEFEFRANSKDITDPERLSLMLNRAEGRLTYKHLIAH